MHADQLAAMGMPLTRQDACGPAGAVLTLRAEACVRLIRPTERSCVVLRTLSRASAVVLIEASKPQAQCL